MGLQAWGLRGDFARKQKIAEDGESSLDDAFAKVCDIFAFEKLTSTEKKQFDK